MQYKRNKMVILGLVFTLILIGVLHTYGSATTSEHQELSNEVYNTLSADPIYLGHNDMARVAEIEVVEPEPTPEIFYPLTDSERKVVECLVEGESGNQSLEGRILVAQCIYNAMVQDNLTPSQVRKQYKYVGWSDTPSEKSKEAVSAIFDRGEMGVDDNILWFYAPKYSKGRFHNTQRFVLEVGGHRFYAPNI